MLRTWKYSKWPISVRPSGVSRGVEMEGKYVLRTFLMQALMQQSINDGAGILKRRWLALSKIEGAV
jgi:hypothetical protein